MDRVALLMTLGLLGVGLSMCTANSVAHVRVRDGRATLPYGDWIDGCIDMAGDLELRQTVRTLAQAARKLRVRRLVLALGVAAVTVAVAGSSVLLWLAVLATV